MKALIAIFVLMVPMMFLGNTHGATSSDYAVEAAQTQTAVETALPIADNSSLDVANSPQMTDVVANTPDSSGQPEVVTAQATVTDGGSTPASQQSNPDNGSAPASQQSNPASAQTIIKSKVSDQISFDLRKLFNNIWGAPEQEALTSGIYLSPGQSFGWYWNRASPILKPGQPCIQPIYPSLKIGGSPWEKSASESFPIKLADIKSLTLETTYRYTTAPTGMYDLAYDIFFTETDQPSTTPDRKAEVMIWINGTAKQPPTSYRGDFSDGDNVYVLYSLKMADGRLYYSFIMKGNSQYSGQHKVDAKKLIDNLKLKPDWYIHGIELGNEVWNGSGQIDIKNVNVNLNGTAS